MMMGRGQSDTFFSKKNPCFQIYCVWPHFLITEFWCLSLLEVSYTIPQTWELKQTELYFLIALESESLRLMCQGGWFLLRLFFLACRWPLSCHLFTWSPVCAQTPGIPFFSLLFFFFLLSVFFIFYLQFFKINFYWSIVALQCCFSF